MCSVAVPTSLVADTIAVVLRQSGFAVEKPGQPAAVDEILHQAGRLTGEAALMDAHDLEPWQPCLLSMRVPGRVAERKPTMTRDDRMTALTRYEGSKLEVTPCFALVLHQGGIAAGYRPDRSAVMRAGCSDRRGRQPHPGAARFARDSQAKASGIATEG